MRLADIAHARAGDKGDTSIIMVAPFNSEDFRLLGGALSRDRLALHYGTDIRNVEVLALPKLLAYSVVLRSQLGGGVTRSLRVDPHGKTLASYLLTLTI